MKIRIGSRGSDLALAQAYYVEHRLKNLPDPPQTEIIIIKTSGDIIQDIPLSQAQSPDDRKGFFTKEIEDALLAKTIDLAVHSYKDLPSQDVPGLMIASVPQRIEPYDVFLYRKDRKVYNQFPFVGEGSRIGTSSVRRIAQIESLFPEWKPSQLRGNVPTRIKKLLDDVYDGILLSGAGIKRLGLPEGADKVIEMYTIPPRIFTPAPAQGALALQCRTDDKETLELLSRIHDQTLANEVRAERLVLSALEGGCHLPLGAYCQQDEYEFYVMHIFLGAESKDNRKKKSYTFTRKGRSPEQLASSVVTEIRQTLPVVLTGREERVQELVEAHKDKNLIPFPLIRTREITPSVDELEAVKTWFHSHKNDHPVICAFSAVGVKNFLRILFLANISMRHFQWAVVGEKTEEEVHRCFPDNKILFSSPDGTGASLAKEMLRSGMHLENRLFAIAALKGREEFYEILLAQGIRTKRMALYETLAVSPAAEEWDALPENCYVVFGSPSAIQVYFDYYDEVPQGHRLCTLGPTTSWAIEEKGVPVYASSEKPDFDVLVAELS